MIIVVIQVKSTTLMQVARVQAGIDCANCTVDNSLIGRSPGNYYNYRIHLRERRKVARYTPYGCTRVHNHRGSWLGYVNQGKRGMCVEPET